jgi:O-acetyl-ADP-ribose deacetylase (regulator of RNase III)
VSSLVIGWDSIEIHSGSILDSKADAIVNPANSHLRHGGGLARVIEQAATRIFDGTELPGACVSELKAAQYKSIEQRAQWADDHTHAPLIATGDAYATSPGRLPFKAVIHAVGPVWGGGDFQEPVLLSSAHQRAIDVAKELGYESIAFPAISCGIFGYPVEQAAQVALATAHWNEPFEYEDPFRIEFWLFESEHVQAYTAALRRVVG